MSAPGFWSDIGRRTNDLLYKDFSADQKFSISTTTSTGLVFNSTAVKKGDLLDGNFVAQFIKKNVHVDVKVDTDSKIHSTVKVNDVAPGTKAIFTFTLPDQKSAKAEVQYTNQYVGLTSRVGLTSSPVVEGTCLFGSNDVSVGGEAAFDTASGKFTKYNIGVGFNKPDFSAAIVWADKGDTVKASYSHLVAAKGATIGAEMIHKLSNKQNTFALGGSYGLDPLTTVKARITNHGKVGTVLQHEFRPKSFITFSGEIDSKAIDKNAKVGVAVSLKP